MKKVMILVLFSMGLYASINPVRPVVHGAKEVGCVVTSLHKCKKKVVKPVVTINKEQKKN